MYKCTLDEQIAALDLRINNDNQHFFDCEDVIGYGVASLVLQDPLDETAVIVATEDDFKKEFLDNLGLKTSTPVEYKNFNQKGWEVFKTEKGEPFKDISPDLIMSIMKVYDDTLMDHCVPVITEDVLVSLDDAFALLRNEFKTETEVIDTVFKSLQAISKIDPTDNLLSNGYYLDIHCEQFVKINDNLYCIDVINPL